MFRIASTALAALLLASPLAASSQELPSYAQSPQGNSGDEQIRGRITSFDGAYALTVSDERGFVDNVDLHPGTIINPTGLTLAPGMVVSILGYNSGDAFAANEVDTPYSYDSGVPYYAGHRYDYYGPSISLGFFFGNVGWWHGNDFRGNYSYNRGVRSYNEVRVSNVVRSSNDGYRNDDAFRNGNAYPSAGAARNNTNPVTVPRDNAPRFDRSAAPSTFRGAQPAQATQQRSYNRPAETRSSGGGGGGRTGAHAGSGERGGHAH